MGNEDLLNTINSLTNTYYAALGFVATVILGVLAFVFWDRVNFKKSFEKEFKIFLKEELKNQKLEIDYYYLKYLPFIDSLETRYRGMGVSNSLMGRPVLRYCDILLNRIINLYKECVGTAFDKFFGKYSRKYYDIYYKIIENTRIYSINYKDTLIDIELNAIEKMNDRINQLNYIFKKYDFLEFKAIVLDKTK